MLKTNMWPLLTNMHGEDTKSMVCLNGIGCGVTSKHIFLSMDSVSRLTYYCYDERKQVLQRTFRNLLSPDVFIGL